MNEPLDPSSEPSADAIVKAADARALGSHPALRSAANVAWSAFIGASLAMVVMLLVPEGWLDPPVGFERLSLAFLFLWTLAVVPALSAVLLCRARPEQSGEG